MNPKTSTKIEHIPSFSRGGLFARVERVGSSHADDTFKRLADMLSANRIIVKTIDSLLNDHEPYPGDPNMLIHTQMIPRYRPIYKSAFRNLLRLTVSADNMMSELVDTHWLPAALPFDAESCLDVLYKTMTSPPYTEYSSAISGDYYVDIKQYLSKREWDVMASAKKSFVARYKTYRIHTTSRIIKILKGTKLCDDNIWEIFRFVLGDTIDEPTLLKLVYD